MVIDMKSRRYKIVNPIRFFVFVFICVFTIVFASYSIATVTSADASAANTYQQVTITDNGSLWEVAESHCQSNMDIRDYIDDICDINDITSNDILQPGQVIFVPIYS